MEWAWNHADAALHDELSSLTLAQALTSNAPDQAAWAWTKVSHPIFFSAPDSAAAIGDVDLSARPAVADHIKQAIDEFNITKYERANLFRVCLDRWSLLASTPCASAALHASPRRRI